MSRESLRDQSVERLLKESFRTSARTWQPGSCLDAETLAAWIDGSLAGGQLTAAREHLADCVDCRATLAAFARTTSPEAVPEPWWRRVPSARWLVPVAATATVIAIWVAVPRDEYTRQPEQPTAADDCSGCLVASSRGTATQMAITVAVAAMGTSHRALRPRRHHGSERTSGEAVRANAARVA